MSLMYVCVYIYIKQIGLLQFMFLHRNCIIGDISIHLYRIIISFGIPINRYLISIVGFERSLL